MTDRSESDFDDGADDAREWLREDLNKRGARSAYAALLAVCEDPKAPAPARATAGVALLRAAGMFERKDDGRHVEPHEMTAGQLAASIVKAKRTLARLAATSDADSRDVFS